MKRSAWTKLKSFGSKIHGTFYILKAKVGRYLIFRWVINSQFLSQISTSIGRISVKTNLALNYKDIFMEQAEEGITRYLQ